MKNRLPARVRKKSYQHGIAREDDGYADARLLELVSLRVAQIHQCPVAMEMHRKKLKAKGETKKRLDQLEHWSTSSLFDENERAALALCEKITLDPAHPLPDHLIQEARHYFTEGAVVSLTLAIMSVNDWSFMSSQ